MKAVTMLNNGRFISDHGSGTACYYDSRYKLVRTRLSSREQSFNLAFEMFIKESMLESKAIVFVVDDDVSMRVIADHARTTAFLIAEGIFRDQFGVSGQQYPVPDALIRKIIQAGVCAERLRVSQR